MKLIKIALFIPALSLCACNFNLSEPGSNKSNISESSYIYSSSSNTQSEQGNEDVCLGEWNENELSLLADYLYGVDIPCVRVEGNDELVYDSDNGCLSLYGATGDEDIILSIDDIFSSISGWIGGEYDPQEYPGLYSYEKEFETNLGKRIVTVDFYCIDGNNEYVSSGDLYIDFYDSYYYSWEEINVSYYLSQFSTPFEETIPELTAAYYYVDTYDFAYGYDTITIYGYEVSKTQYEDFKSTLENSGYTIGYDSEYECDTAKKGSSFEIDIWYYEDGQSIFVELFDPAIYQEN